MITMSEQPPSEEIGERLRIARERANLTQAAAAAALEMARTTVVAIEQGQRRVRLDELQKFSRLYGTSVNALLRREAVSVDLKPRFRKSGQISADVEAAVELMTSLVEAELELENILGVQRTRNDPPERPLAPGDVVLQAEQDALEIRHWLGLGVAPLQNVVSLLEMQLGVRIYVRKLAPQISGLYAFAESVGACILLNANHPRERRAQTAAHELGHFISTRRAPDTLYEGSPETSREERYANAFARAFLTPARAVMARFKEITAGGGQLTRRHVIILAHTFGISREAMVRRLEELKLVRPGAWEWFSQNGGITDEHVRQVLGSETVPDLDRVDSKQLIPLRVGTLVVEAWRRSLISEGQIARLFQLDRVEVREILEAAEAEGGGSDEALMLPI
ncbi:MAG: hypothetical protein RLY86_3749 [Pseudomonadota bacterium]|jgi:Zn-dependent peptidase ImmA (M78 family)